MTKPHITDDEAKAMNSHWDRLMQRRARDLLNRFNVPATPDNLYVARANIEVIDINARRDAYDFAKTEHLTVADRLRLGRAAIGTESPE